MRRSALHGWLLVMALVGCAGSPPSPKSTLAFDLYIEVVGPAVETWVLKYDGGTTMSTQISHGAGSGELKGSRYVYESFEPRIREAVVGQRFFELPRTIMPAAVAVDSPSAVLKITLDGREHSVMVSDPGPLGGDERYARFKAVFDVILSFIPVKPRWG